MPRTNNEKASRPLARLVEVPEGWENGGDLWARFDGVALEAYFGDSDEPLLTFRFDWVRSFRYVSEASYDTERDGLDVMDALLSELALPNAHNPSNDYYDQVDEFRKEPPRLFRLFHYKAGFFEIVASDWSCK